MFLKIFISSLCSFVLGAALFGATRSITTVEALVGENIQDARQADKEAIRAHIDRIFKGFINGDCNTLRNTHAQNWIGFTGNARSIEKGLEAYMNGTARWCADPTLINPAQGLSGYNITEIDYSFYDDVALVPYVAETTYGKNGLVKGKLRSLDVYAKVNGEWTQVGSNIFLHPDIVQARCSSPGRLTPVDQKALFTTRENVWRAFFSNDSVQLEKLLPAEALAIDGSATGAINNRADILDASKTVSQAGKLIRLEFPKTEMQLYGDTAVLYTTYLLELETAPDRHTTQTGRGIEIFVKRNGVWLNTGWSLQTDKL